MPTLSDIPPIVEANPEPIYAMVPEQHLALMRAVWEQDGIPFASMKLENDLSKATGITFTFAGYRYDRRKRQQSLRSVFQHAGRPADAEDMLELSKRIGSILNLMCLPVEVAGFDVGPGDVRQTKTYIRTNIANERFVDRFIESEPTSREAELELVSTAMMAVAPKRRDSVLNILRRLQATKGALEGIAIDLGQDGADVKMYFLPQYVPGRADAFTDSQTMEFVDAALDMFDLVEHRGRALAMVADMRRAGLGCSFLAVEEKPDGSHELKVDFNTTKTGTTFPGRRAPPKVAAAAIQAAFDAVGLQPDPARLARLVAMIGPDGVLLDDFTTDFSAAYPAGKVYLRSGADLGSGVLPRR